jgi:shikimate dehydrogenase
VRGRPAALVLGNGGAARAAVVACQMAGIVQVGVSARRFKSELGREHWDNAAAFRDLGALLLAWPDTKSEEVAEYLQSTHLLVQATSAGMKGTQGGGELCEALPWESFHGGVAYDLVYNPPVTPFLSRAAELGHAAVGGLGMLVGQARDAIEIWVGQKPERGPMMSAARRALGL